METCQVGCSLGLVSAILHCRHQYQPTIKEIISVSRRTSDLVYKALPLHLDTLFRTTLLKVFGKKLCQWIAHNVKRVSPSKEMDHLLETMDFFAELSTLFVPYLIICLPRLGGIFKHYLTGRCHFWPKHWRRPLKTVPVFQKLWYTSFNFCNLSNSPWEHHPRLYKMSENDTDNSANFRRASLQNDMSLYRQHTEPFPQSSTGKQMIGYWQVLIILAWTLNLCQFVHTKI